jgi:hypothetical protein
MKIDGLGAGLSVVGQLRLAAEVVGTIPELPTTERKGVLDQVILLLQHSLGELSTVSSEMGRVELASAAEAVLAALRPRLAP